MYYVYMLRCEDNSIYTGITNDLERRLEEHFSKNEKCAKYTKTHSVKKIETAWETEDRVSSSKLEYAIKRLKKDQKENIIKNKELDYYFSEKLDCSKYKRININ